YGRLNLLASLFRIQALSLCISIVKDVCLQEVRAWMILVEPQSGFRVFLEPSIIGLAHLHEARVAAILILGPQWIFAIEQVQRFFIGVDTLFLHRSVLGCTENGLPVLEVNRRQ